MIIGLGFGAWADARRVRLPVAGSVPQPAEQVMTDPDAALRFPFRRLRAVPVLTAIVALALAGCETGAGSPGVGAGQGQSVAQAGPDTEAPETQVPPVAVVDVAASGRPRIPLTDTDGRERSLDDYRGRLVALFFGYTQCPDICGSTMYRLQQAAQALGERREQTVFIMVSVDGGHDSPEVMASYVKRFDPDFVGLTGPQSRVRQLAVNFGGVAMPATRAQDRERHGDWIHTAPVYLLDREGTWRRTLAPTARPHDIVAAIGDLLGR
ncbi:MAG: SCO family protein [Burkholderiaceae bacterium]